MNMRQVKFSNLNSQFQLVEKEVMASWANILRSSSFIGGPQVKTFESEFASYLGVAHCIGMANGTDALEIAFRALDLPAGSIVLVPANSFVATAEAAVNVGLKVRFVDVREDFAIDLEDLRNKVDDEVSCIAVVHLYGHPAPMAEILTIANKVGLKVVEDCAQAHGAEIDGRKVGTFGEFGAFSFYPGKNLGAAGDAGALVTGDGKLAEKARRIANHGRLSKFDHNLVGRNSRLDSIQAAFLSEKLKHLDTWNAQRNENAETYRNWLEASPYLTLPPKVPGSVYHHFVVRTNSRDQLRDFLSSHQIETGVHYPQAIHEMEPFLDTPKSHCPSAAKMSYELVSLPVAEHLTSTDIQYVAQKLNHFFRL
jgi:dTDP-4-amino-4,6-dideoxygalactose transaminase